MKAKKLFGKRNPFKTYYVFRRWTKNGGRLDAFQCELSESACKDRLPTDLLSLFPGKRYAFTTVRARNKTAAINGVSLRRF